MDALNGQSILIVVDGDTNEFIEGLQREVERAGAETLVAGDHPDTLADTLTTFEFTAAVVAVGQQEVVAELNVPTVVYYDGDNPEQVVARLVRVLE
jgi:hypothetical protein